MSCVLRNQYVSLTATFEIELLPELVQTVLVQVLGVYPLQPFWHELQRARPLIVSSLLLPMAL
jgi:hypothetical protein